MDWSDRGIVLSVRRHGETSAIAHVLTDVHGRHAGLVRGGAGRRSRGTLQPGNEVSVSWRARLSEHLGTFTLELARARAAEALQDPLRLAAVSAAAEIADAALPERAPHPAAYAALAELLDAVASDTAGWTAAYARWELGFLAEIGSGLDLEAARTPGRWAVSLRTGAALAAGGPGPLLPLPPFLLDRDASSPPQAVRDALTLTGAFLKPAVPDARRLAARTRFLQRLETS